jgi:hypothetical protein
MRASFHALTPAIAGDPRPVRAAGDLDTSNDLEIGPSGRFLAPLIAMGFAMTFLSASLASNWWGTAVGHETAAGYAGVVLFGIATCRLIWMLPTGRGPVVVISRYGVRDLRIGDEFLLWDSIAEISAGECRGRKVVVLKPTRALQRQRCCVETRRAAPDGNHDADRVVISPAGLATEFDTLLQACLAYRASALQQKNSREAQSFAVQPS